MIRSNIPAFVLILAIGLGGQELSKEPVISDAEIQQILTERVEQKRQNVGIVVGVIEDRGERIVSQGVVKQGEAHALNANTTFEIGGLTGVFTAFLLADMARRGEVAVTDPVAKYLPPTVKVPTQNGQPITLEELATHTAGLPLMPPHFHAKNTANPFADFSEIDLYQSLSNCQLTGTLGVDYQYSNLGMALLAQALSKRTGQSYETLLKTRIFDPLGMKSTGVTVTPEMKAQLAVGHNGLLQPVSYWDTPAMAGALGLKSTVQDLLTFVEAALGYGKAPGPLVATIASMLTVRKPTRYPGLELALGWHILTTNATQIMWHNGGTGGFRAFMGFSSQRKVGIVVLSNTDGANGIEDIGLRLFQPAPAQSPPSRERIEIKVDPSVFANYVGVYQLNDGLLLTITQDEQHLEAEIGQQKFKLAAESTKDYFVKSIDGQLTFVTDRTGRAYQVVLHQAGIDLPAKRVK